MCKAFPTEVSCELPNVGAAGGEQNHNGLCVLSQNIINEKMYLAIWFWMVSLIIISPFCIMYRISTIFFDGFRSILLISKFYNFCFNFKTIILKIEYLKKTCIKVAFAILLGSIDIPKIFPKFSRIPKIHKVRKEI